MASGSSSPSASAGVGGRERFGGGPGCCRRGLCWDGDRDGRSSEGELGECAVEEGLLEPPLEGLERSDFGEKDIEEMDSGGMLWNALYRSQEPIPTE